MKRSVLLILPLVILAAGCNTKQVSKNEIDRQALVGRHNPHVTAIDSLSALSVGNGTFMFTADITGLQSFTEQYAGGIPLNTEADWGWHSFSNVLNLKPEQALGADGYPAIGKVDATAGAAIDYFTLNDHRINLGSIGFEDFSMDAVSDPDQTLDLYTGVLTSTFKYNGKPVKVVTSCDPVLDMVAFSISNEDLLPVMLSLPYTNLSVNGDPSYWEYVRTHDSELRSEGNCAVIKVKMNTTRYYVKLNLENAYFRQPARNRYEIVPTASDWGFTAEFTREYKAPAEEALVASSRAATEKWWKEWWEQEGAVDFSGSTDPRAAELERRVVLSQYLTAIQCSGLVPPQSTGLTGRSNFGKIEADNVWWQTAHFAFWGHPEQLKSTLTWYKKSYDNALARAKARGYLGACWPWLAGSEGVEVPFNVNAHAVSHQPQLIYLVHLLDRAGVDVSDYEELVKATGQYMVDFAEYDEKTKAFNISGVPMQGKQETVALNPSFELAYWYYCIRLLEEKGWRFRQVAVTNQSLKSIDGIYTSAEKGGNTSTEGHPAVLGALGMLPGSSLVDTTVMSETLNWMLDNWSWETASGQDYAMAAMTATRLGAPEKALEALFMDSPTNRFLANGQNPQDEKMTTYVPGNGGLLAAVALMCAGWDGCEVENPGFPKDGSWKVKWEGITPLP